MLRSKEDQKLGWKPSFNALGCSAVLFVSGESEVGVCRTVSGGTGHRRCVKIGRAHV